MTATPSHPLTGALVSDPQRKHGASRMKNLAQKPRRENFAGAQHKNSSRAWFASLLWRAFPATSEREVARRAAPLAAAVRRRARPLHPTVA